MSKLTLASKLADEFGVSFSKASKFVDEVGVQTARQSLDDAAAFGSKAVKLSLGGGAILGGGALAWRQQDVARARAIAESQASYRDTISQIIESDLPPEVKANMAEQASGEGSSSGGDGSGGGGGGGGGGGPGNGLIPDDPQTLIILMIVLIFTLKFGLEGDD